MLPLILMQVALIVPPAPLLAPDSLRFAIAETGAIWSPHGVDILLVGDAEDAPADAIVIAVAITRRAGGPDQRQRGALGEIAFDGSGAPAPLITLFLPNLLEMVAATPAGGNADTMPVIVRERAIGRAVGRVLAHELGHYLLRSTAHAAIGLMRAVHSCVDLMGPDRQLFTLSPSETARLAALHASWTSCVC